MAFSWPLLPNIDFILWRLRTRERSQYFLARQEKTPLHPPSSWCRSITAEGVDKDRSAAGTRAVFDSALQVGGQKKKRWDWRGGGGTRLPVTVTPLCRGDLINGFRSLPLPRADGGAAIEERKPPPDVNHGSSDFSRHHVARRVLRSVYEQM